MQDLHIQPRIIPPAPVTCPALLAVFLMEFAAVTVLFAWLVLPLGFILQKVASLPWLIVLLSASPTWRLIHESLRNLHFLVCFTFYHQLYTSTLVSQVWCINNRDHQSNRNAAYPEGNYLHAIVSVVLD